MLTCCVWIVLAPLIGSLLSGFFRKQIGRSGAHSVTLLGVGSSLALSVYVAYSILFTHEAPLNINYILGRAVKTFFRTHFISDFW